MHVAFNLPMKIFFSSYKYVHYPNSIIARVKQRGAASKTYFNFDVQAKHLSDSARFIN